MVGPRLYRFFNYESFVYLPAPTGGWNPDANPWELPDNQAQILDNFILGPGRVSMRGALETLVQPGPHFEPVGYVIGNTSAGSFAMLSGKVRNAAHVIDPWHAPLLGANAANLAGGSTAGQYVSIGANSISPITYASLDAVPGPRWINFDGLLYGISYDSAGAATFDANNNYAMKPLSLLTLPYTQSSAILPTVRTLAPHGAFDLKGHQSRVWLLGGIDTPGGLTAHEPNTLFYTNPGRSGVGTASADWKDPITGNTNKIVMDNNNADYGIGLAIVPNAMVVFRRASVWVLRGTTSASYQLQSISREVGCLDARSIVETDHGVYFMSARGLMLTDGVSVKAVSDNVANQIQSSVARVENSIRAETGGWFSCAVTSQGHIIVSMGTGNAGLTGAMQTVWSGMYDPALNAWTRITSALWNSDNANSASLPPLFVSRPENQQLYTVGDLNFVQLEDYSSINSIGTSFLLNDSVALGMYDHNLVGTSWSLIPAQWRTRLVTIISSTLRKNAQGHRYVVDYLFGANPAPATTTWKIAARDASDNALNTLATVPVGGSTPSAGIEATVLPRVQRVNQDFFNEIADMYFDVTSVGTDNAGQAAWRADVYGIGIESQRTSEAR